MFLVEGYAAKYPTLPFLCASALDSKMYGTS